MRSGSSRTHQGGMEEMAGRETERHYRRERAAQGMEMGRIGGRWWWKGGGRMRGEPWGREREKRELRWQR
jgi:hypothetical protein